MKLRMELSCGQEKRPFTSADVVTGLLSLDIRNRQSLSELRLSVTGNLALDGSRYIGLENVQIPYYYKVFEISKPLFPKKPMCASTRYTFAPGLHDYDFVLDLALLTRCLYAKLADLPVPEHFRRANVRAHFEINATAIGCGFFRRHRHCRIAITPVVLEPPSISSMFYDGRRLECQAYQVISYRTLGLSREEVPDLRGVKGGVQARHEFLPVYSPAIVLGVVLGSCDVENQGSLHLGEPSSLSFWVMSPKTCAETGDVWLRGIRVSLFNTSVSHNVGRRLVQISDTVASQAELDLPLHVGDIRTQTGTVPIDISKWGERIPQWESITSRRREEYLLQMLFEFSASNVSSKVFATVIIPLILDRTPSPAYSPGVDVNHA
ncbi:hypothetical protein GGS24DRAFT_444160 [Hypoxylon argillaceum]|nr:hypothetical protein GGS24DRAFT_444160 [Hypoxylon argillaceum]